MSIEQSPSVSSQLAEHSKGTVGLKRKLTGPPRLLLAKFKAKRQLDSRASTKGKRSRGFRDNNANQLTTESIRTVKLEEGAIQNLKVLKSTGSEADGLMNNNFWSGRDDPSLRSWVRAGESGMRSKKPQKTKSKDKEKWQRVCQECSVKPSLICLGKRRNKRGRNQWDKCRRSSSITFCSAEMVGSAQLRKLEMGNLERLCRFDDEDSVRRAFPDGLWTSLRKFMTQQRKSPNSKGRRANQDTDSETQNSLSSKKSKSFPIFFKHKAKETLSCQSIKFNNVFEEFGGDPEAALSNKCLEGAPDILHDFYRDYSSRSVALPADRLTVNVEVSLVTPNSAESEESLISSFTKSMVVTCGDVNSGRPSVRDIQQNKLVSASQYKMRDIKVSQIKLVERIKELKSFKMEPTGAEEQCLPDYSSDCLQASKKILQMSSPFSDTESALCSEKVSENGGDVMARHVAQDANEQLCEDAHIHDGKSSMAGRGGKHGSPTNIPLINVCELGKDCEPPTLVIESVNPQDDSEITPGWPSGQLHEMLLSQTACSLVQAAMKAAIDQLTGEGEAPPQPGKRETSIVVDRLKVPDV
ncbi:uncharacterized protein LOC127526004 [Erpetoichthys calabaricus]|uniref:uncharacterized protein LOC127526004 n=1 Tax=Erpetoichthys calabaricus TaxID=27687 RepID=UPI002234DCF3|nr:uncharacterized protein LOC127526004 [Erpetoichthys calabaricus]